VNAISCSSLARSSCCSDGALPMTKHLLFLCIPLKDSREGNGNLLIEKYSPSFRPGIMGVWDEPIV